MSLFKKLQREAEQASRRTDQQGVGSLSKQLLATCLKELGYLKSSQPDYFTESLWCLINPRRNLTITNAVAYDILLLLTYKVTLSVTQLTQAVSEYLHRLYTE